MQIQTATAILVGLMMVAFVPAVSAEAMLITIKDHQFSPKELKVPSGQKLQLKIRNEDSTPEEFESPSLKREKVVKGNSEITLNVGPLKPGRYDFVGEFHEASAKGALIAE